MGGKSFEEFMKNIPFDWMLATGSGIPNMKNLDPNSLNKAYSELHSDKIKSMGAITSDRWRVLPLRLGWNRGKREIRNYVHLGSNPPQDNARVAGLVKRWVNISCFQNIVRDVLMQQIKDDF